MRSLLKVTSALCFAAVLMIGFNAHATTSTNTTTTTAAKAPKAPPSSGNAAVDAAMKSCAESVAKDERGGPDRAAMDACLKEKGVEPPKNGTGGPPPKGEKPAGNPPPPPQGDPGTDGKPSTGNTD